MLRSIPRIFSTPTSFVALEAPENVRMTKPCPEPGQREEHCRPECCRLAMSKVCGYSTTKLR
jgi:hypothetical protein